MIRALHVIESCAAGGIETTFLNAVRAWHEAPAWATHDVLTFAGGPLEEAFRAVTQRVMIATTWPDLTRIPFREYDIVYVLFERCAYRLLPFILGRSAVPVVYGKGYDMSSMFRTDEGFVWRADDSMMWGADATTFTTPELMASFEAPGGRRTPLGKAADVRHFLAIPPVDASTPRRIVCVANLHVRKRLGDLVAATAQLRHELPDLAVRFVGADNGGEGDRLRGSAARLGIGEAIELVGRRPDVADDIAASRVFALPSGCEGVPTAMLEAMAGARPVVMTDIGHIRAVVRDGVDGFLCPPGDVDALATRLRVLLTDVSTSAQMGRAARERVRSHDIRIVASRLRSVLEQAARSVSRERPQRYELGRMAS